MPEPEATDDLQAMREALAAVLDALRVARVVVIDDEYASAEVAVEDVVGAVQAEPGRFRDLVPALEQVEEEELEAVARAVQAAMRNAQTAQLLSERLRAAEDPDDHTDARTRDVLGTLCEGITLEYLPLSASEWEARRSQLCAQDDWPRSFVLVDRNFEREGLGPDYGFELIRQLTGEREVGPFCALFSHTIAPEKELDEWDAFASEHTLPKERFVVVSKRRLAEGEPDYAGFIQLLRMAALSPPLSQLRSMAAEFLQSAVEESLEEMSQWTVFDFDEAVFGSSRGEGLWEGDTLLRVFATFTLSRARRELLQHEQAADHIAAARRASAIQIPGRERYLWTGVGKMALRYQQAELYEEADVLNPNFFPPEAGDVFEDQAGKMHVLVAQPCDLMVRPDAGRAYDSALTRMVPLCELVTSPPTGANSYELPHWDQEGVSAHVRLARVNLVRLAVIDLCAMNDSGQATFVSDEDPPNRLTEPWREQHARIQKLFKREVELHSTTMDAIQGAQLSGADRRRVEKRALPCCSNTGRFRATRSESGFAFNLTRVRRVRQPLAADVLRAFSSFQSRTAFEHAIFTKELADRVLDTGEEEPE